MTGRETAGAGRAGGRSLLQLAIAVAVISALAAALLVRVELYQEMAEKTAMELVARNLQSAVRLTVAEAMLAERWERIAALAGGNPMELLERKPGNYRGVLPAVSVDSAESGAWYYDPRRRELVYIPQRRARLVSPEGDEPRIRYRISVVSERAAPGSMKTLYWARLELIEPYRWVQ